MVHLTLMRSANGVVTLRTSVPAAVLAANVAMGKNVTPSSVSSTTTVALGVVPEAAVTFRATLRVLA
jgi:hypothetical protein